VALPPDASKVKPVVNEQALDTIKAKISAAVRSAIADCS
jgi:hypothetical protein